MATRPLSVTVGRPGGETVRITVVGEALAEHRGPEPVDRRHAG